MQRLSTQRFENFWNFADKNNDGKIGFREFRHAVVNFRTGGGHANIAPPIDLEIMKLFQSLDDDMDKLLSKKEYFSHVGREDFKDEKLIKAFKKFDRNGDGFISRQELTDLMVANGYKERSAKAVLDKVDTDGDGLINFHELMDIMLNH